MKSYLTGALVSGAASSAAHAAGLRIGNVPTPRPAAGTHKSDTYSIASSIKAEGFDERVRCIGGLADYTFERTARDSGLVFKSTACSANRPAAAPWRSSCATLCLDGDCQACTAASGLTYSRLLWGAAPVPTL